jgi:hypothetical protein
MVQPSWQSATLHYSTNRSSNWSPNIKANFLQDNAADNAAPHKVAIMHQELADLHFEVLKHPAYLPDLAPSDLLLPS